MQIHFIISNIQYALMTRALSAQSGVTCWALHPDNSWHCAVYQAALCSCVCKRFYTH